MGDVSGSARYLVLAETPTDICMSRARATSAAPPYVNSGTRSGR